MGSIPCVVQGTLRIVASAGRKINRLSRMQQLPLILAAAPGGNHHDAHGNPNRQRHRLLDDSD